MKIKKIHHILQNDGLFIAVIPAPSTLQELRIALDEATIEIEGGLRPRISPFIDIQDAGDLLYKAGFHTPIADSEKVEISYNNMFSLLKDIKNSGESNILTTQNKAIANRKIFALATEIYADKFTDKNGKIIATIELLTLIGWKKVL